jgi:preprotein translocase subunit YajC
MQSNLITWLVTVILVTLLSGAVIFSLLTVAVLIFIYMYNAVRNDKQRREQDRRLNDYLKETGQLN